MKLLCLFALLFCMSANAQGELTKGIEKPDENAVYDSHGLPVKPGYPGGFEAFYGFLAKNIKVPDELITSGKAVKVYFYFIVEKDGSMSSIKILRNPGYDLDKEVLRVLNSMEQKWEPGIQNGRPVRASLSLPVTVNMSK